MPLFSMRSFHLLAALTAVLGAGSLASAQTATPTPVPVIANSTFVPASGFFDFVADNGRGMLYLSSGTQIVRYRRSDQAWLAPVEVGGDLRALDISPDGSTLAVADAKGSTRGTPGTISGRVALINLNSLAVTNILFPLRSGEAGAYSLAYDANGNLLIAPAISPTTAQAGAFRVWNAATNQTAVIYAQTVGGGINDTGVATNTAIVADSTRNCLSFVEMASSTGNWGFYSPSGTSPTGTVGTLTRFMAGLGVSGGNYPNDVAYGIAPDSGSRFFMPTGSSLQVRSSGGTFINRYGTGSPVAANNSAAFDSSRSLLYLTPSTSAKIEIRDPSSLNSLGFLNAGMVWGGSPSMTSAGIPLPYAISRMRATSDGTLLGVRVTDGVRLYTLQNGLPASTPLVTDSLTTPEDTAYSFALDSPARNASGTSYDIAQRPAHGTLTGNGVQSSLSFTYTPAANYNGSDSFAVAVHTQGGSYTIQNVGVSITPVNDAPVAVDGSMSNHINETRFIPLWATDVDLTQPFYTDPNFSFDIVTKPAHGSVVRPSTTQLAYFYTPDSGYAGDDSFTFRAFDGQAYSNVATFTIKNVGAIPVARSDSFSAPLANSVAIAAPGVLANDTQSSVSYLSAVTNVSSGSVALSANGGFTWTAAASGPPDNGIVTFQYSLGDAYYQGTPPQATVTLRLVPLVAQSQNLTTGEDIPLPVHLSASGSTNPTFAITKAPAHGTLSGTAPDLTYTPTADTNGADSFEFSVADGGRTATGTVSITVNPINDAPSAPDATLATDEDTPLAVTLVASDVEGDTLSYEIVQAPAIGTLVAGATAGTYTYTPPVNFNGPVFFNWRANDGALNSRVATVKINVAPVNDAPVASDFATATDEDTTVPVPFKATDVDNGVSSLTFKVTKAPAHGRLVGNSPNFFYQPDANWNGTDSFEYVANDGALDSAPATGTISVRPVNDAPTAQSQSVTGNEDTNIDVTLGGSDIEGDTLTFQITRQPQHGTLKQTGSAVVYRAFDDWNGTDSFGFVANDGTLSSAEATVTVVVSPVSDTPVARADAYSTDEDSALSISAPGVLANDVDVDGKTLRAVLKTQPANGAVVLNANGGFSYTPDRDWSGTDSFTYAASDGTLESAAVTVTVTVAAVNDAPIARPDVFNGTEDTALTIASSALLANDYDAEGDALSISAVTNPAHGTLAAQDGGYLYIPAANYNGDDAFSYTLSDGTTNATGSVTLHIKAVNDAPVAEAQTLSLDEDGTKAMTLSGSDVDGDALTFKVTRQPANGTLSGTAPNLTYTPAANFNGSDSFAFVANDGSVDSATVTVALTINSVNDAPVALAQGIALDEDTSKGFTLGGTDIEGDALTFKVIRGPEHGTLSGTAPNLTFTPDANWNGTTTLDFTVSDGTLESAPASVQIRVNAVNDAPTAAAQAVTTSEDTPKTFVLGGSDVDGDALTFKITRQPAKGTLVLNGSNVTYSPAQDINGSDSFAFAANDGTVDSVSATVAITVTPVNDAPVALAQGVALNEDTVKAIVLGGSDVDGDALSFKVTKAPAHGTLSGTAPNLTFTPDKDWNGMTSLDFTVSDGSLESAAATVQIRVNPVNDAPVAAAQAVTTNEDTAKTVVLGASDVDGDALTFKITRQPAKGTLILSGGNATYTPSLDWNGSDSFVFVANDGTVDSVAATVTITVTAVNDAPAATPQTATLDEDTAKSVVLSGSDVDGDTLSFAVATQPANGTLSGTAPNLTYTPKANFNGNDSFTFSVSDPSGLKSTATVSLVVRPVNDAPVATPLSISTNASTAKSFSVAANATDVDGDALTFAVKTAPANGTVTSQGGANFTYTPRLAFVGTDSFAISATDPSGASATIQVSVTVTAVSTQPNHAPSSQGSNFVILEDGSLTFNLTAYDQDGDALTYIVSQNPQYGTVTANGGSSFTFVPPANYFGTQTFNFYVRDARGATSNNSTVELRTVAVNDAPNYDLASADITVAKNSNVFQQGGFARNLNVGGLPYEQGQVITFSLQTSDTSLFDQQPGISSDGTLMFRPRSGKTGTATVTINARDNGGTSDGGKDTAPVKTFTITIR